MTVSIAGYYIPLLSPPFELRIIFSIFTRSIKYCRYSHNIIEARTYERVKCNTENKVFTTYKWFTYLRQWLVIIITIEWDTNAKIKRKKKLSSTQNQII